MENWLPFFYDETLPTLFDYLPQAYVIAGKNVRDAVKSKEESIADYYQARLEALNIKSVNEADAYRPVAPEPKASRYLARKVLIVLLSSATSPITWKV